MGLSTMTDRELCTVTSINEPEGVFYARVESLGMVREFDLEELSDAALANLIPGQQFVWETGLRDDGGTRERYSRLDKVEP